MSRLFRVAAAQHATGTNVEANLATAVRMIGTAAAQGAELVVLPEFGNHLSVYDDAAHAWDVAITLDGPYVEQLAQAADHHNLWVQANATVRRDPASPDNPRPRITVTNLVFSPDGDLVATFDKTVLMGAENDHLSPATELGTIYHAPFARVGSYACMDGVVPEVPRLAAVRGAELMLNSLNSFALDEASLHIPIRAAENRTWVVACCKVGPLLPDDRIDAFASMMGIPADSLHGAGESQIIAPDGTVVAQAPRTGEAVVVAEIDLDRAGQLRPDGADLRTARRPSIYGRLTEPTPPVDDHARAETIVAAVASTIADVRDLARNADLVVLPELAVESIAAVDALSEPLAGTAATVVTTVRDDDALSIVVVDASGLVASGAVMHSMARHPWSTRLGDEPLIVERPWGRLCAIGGDDVLFPESTRLAALDSVDVVAISFAAHEPWDMAIGVPERAAENRVITVASASGPLGGGCIADLHPDFTLWAPSRERSFDGTINQPIVTRCVAGSSVSATVHPSRSPMRQISRGTDLVDGRPWQLCGPLAD